MRTFLWTFLVIEGLTVLGWVLIAAGVMPDPNRTPAKLVVNAIVGLAFMAWALWLLAGG